MSVEVVAKKSTSHVGEGPHWEERTQTLLYVDIGSGNVHRYDPATQKDVKHHIGGDVTLIVPRTAGGYVIGHNRCLSLFDWDTGKTTALGEVDHGTKNRFNDGKCDHTGRLWAGTMGHEVIPGQPERLVGSLYTLEKNHSIVKRFSPVDISNGLAWSADNRILYYIDSVPRKVFAFDYDSVTGSITNQRVAVDFGGDETRDEMGLPDGMCIDQEGMLWVACFFGGKVVRFDSSTGKTLRTVKIPARRVTSCCFGGKDYTDLYVTCGTVGADEQELKDYPLTGSLFKVTGLGVKGLPAYDFAG